VPYPESVKDDDTEAEYIERRIKLSTWATGQMILSTKLGKKNKGRG
jgi:hypothetical protein